jgi:prophage antirepressor-like protein
MSTMIPFDFEDALVRVIDQGGEPWFVLSDACKVLDITNSRNATARLDDDEKGVHIMDTLGGPQEMTIISESGLYALIFRSRKPEAVRFRKWVTSEVLPTIRKTGSYSAAAETITPDKERELTKELINLQHRLLKAQRELEDYHAQVEAGITAERMIKLGHDDATIAAAINRHPTYAAHVRAIVAGDA